MKPENARVAVIGNVVIGAWPYERIPLPESESVVAGSEEEKASSSSDAGPR